MTPTTTNHPPKALKMLKASAGSGKTFSLTKYFIILLFSGKTKYREILAVTFTNKATAEMKQRVLSVLKALAEQDQSSSTASYRTYLKAAYLQLTDDMISEKARLIYRSILHDYSRFSISTIDKFVHKVIRSFAYELGIDPGFRLEMNYGKVAKELSEKLHQSLDEQPRLLKWIVDYATTQIALNQKWSYEKALLQLAREIFSEDYQDFEEAVKADQENTLFDEITAFIYASKKNYETTSKAKFEQAAEIFRKYGSDQNLLKGKSKNPLMKLNQPYREDWIIKMEKCIDCPEAWSKEPAVTESLYRELNPVLKEMLDFHQQAYPVYILSELLRNNFYFLRLMKEMSRLLAAYRSENMLLLLSDATRLLSGVSKGQEDNPSFIWEKAGIRYKHFLFDEFQDTSKKQWQNFLPLVKNSLGEFSGKRTENLIVGDVKQSIYRWRNGDWRLLLAQAQKDLGKEFVEQDHLLENYRSAVNIINFNNMVFHYGPEWLQEQLNRQVEKEAGIDFFETEWKDKGYDRIIKQAYEDSRQHIPEDTVKFGGTIDLNTFPVENNSHRFTQVKEVLLEHTADTLYRWIVSEKRYKAGQIGILVRDKKDAVALIDYLVQDQKNRSVKNAFQIVSGDALKIETNESVQLLVNTLYLLLAAAEDDSIYKVNCVQLFWQKKAEKDPEIKPITATQWLQIGKYSLAQLTGFLPEKLCREAVQLVELPLAELVEQLISLFDLQHNEVDLPYLLAFRDVIADFNLQGERDIPAFLKWWEEEKAELFLPAAEGSDAVQVVTIHKSKGLAYDVVMLPFAGWEIGRSIRGENFWVNAEHTPFETLKRIPVPFVASLNNTVLKFAYWEERLLKSIDALNELYVALTRAKDRLYINIIGAGENELNSFLVSDLIRCALEKYEAVNGKPFDLNADERSTAEEQPKDRDEKEWSLSFYPRAQHLKLQLNKTVRDQLQRLSPSLGQRLGILAHEALARIKNNETPGTVILKMQTEGLCLRQETALLKETVEKVLAHPQLKALLDLPYEQLNEQTIIDTDGNSYRPDKVFLAQTETIIIDFKFTAEAKSAHVEQIETYKDLLRRMGYPEVKAYLFYGFLDQLVQV